LGPSDLLVLTTRPPLDDKQYKDKKKVIPSRSWFETKMVFPAMRDIFRWCSRLEVDLTEKAAGALREKFKNRAFLAFHIDAAASYASSTAHEKCEKQEPWDRMTTAAYLVHTRQLWPRGPELLAAFGMGGTVGLVWAYLLRKRFPHLLQGSRFVMAEIVRNGPLPPRPLTLEFADKWSARVIADLPL
jgi:hypothetical protein